MCLFILYIDTSNTYIHDPMNVFVYSLHLNVTEIPPFIIDMCSFELCFCFVCLRLVCPVLPVSLCFCFVCLRLVCPVLPVSLYCPFLIAPSAFSNVYLNDVQYILLSFQTYD